jgi:hypothetical protein
MWELQQQEETAPKAASATVVPVGRSAIR